MIRSLALAIVLASTSAFAQQPDMPPIDRDLWQAMQQAFANISMPLPAHQQVQQIMQGIEQEAAKRKVQKDAAQAKPETKP